MTNRMLKSKIVLLVCISVTILAGLWTAPLGAQEQDGVRVLILPFEIYGGQDLAYLSQQIPDVIATHLTRNGARIIPYSGATTAGPVMEADARRIAEQAAATHIIRGRFTLVGNRFTLEADVAGTGKAEQPDHIRTTGSEIENLLNEIRILSEKIGEHIFRQSIIADIQIEGNQRIEADAILRLMQSKVGGAYQPNQLSRDLHAIYNMGYFDDLRVESQSTPQGKIVIVHVREKATIRYIRFKHNQHFDDEKLKENLTIRTGSILNIFKIRNNIDTIINLYKEDNYHQVKVEYAVHPVANNQADLEFIIEEGSKIYITDIRFEGNQAFSEKQLQKEMSTSSKGFFYWLTSSGDLNRAVLEQDVARLNAFYHNQGYIRARIGEPQIDILDTEIHVVIKIEEGPQFKVGKVDVDGDLIMPKADLLAHVVIDKENHFNREKLQQDVIALTDIYADKGYAYTDVVPQINENKDALQVDITYNIDKKEQVFFEKIIISGNTRTRDKVIRRELQIFEQDMFRGKALKRSIRNLYRLEYFEEINPKTLRGSADDQMVLKIDVKEKSTGTFAFGAGYSSEESLFLLGSVSIRNFLGRGQTMQFNGQVGGATSRYTISFTEPWLFDSRLSMTTELYDQDKEYDEYDLESIGGGMRFGYPIFDYTRIYWGYGYDASKVDDVTDEAPDSVLELEGTNVTSSVRLSLGYDSRDRLFNATEGSKHSISYEYAGLGGDIGFTKTIVDTGWYFPLFKGFVGFIHAKAGSVQKISDDLLLPDYEKFYLGGINSLRGFDWHGVHLTKTKTIAETKIDEVSGEESEEESEVEVKVGGEFMAQLNVELLIPLYTKMGLMGLVFYDTGNVYEDHIDLGDLRASWGYGIRWYSPIAPIRLEYGNIIDPRDDEESGRLEFTLGGAF